LTRAATSPGRSAGARFVALPGEDHLVFVGDQAAVLDHARSFVAEHAAGELSR